MSRHSLTSLLVTLFAIVIMVNAPAHAAYTTALHETFDSLPLGPFVSPTEGGGDGTDWTGTPPAGWVKDNGTTPIGNPVEFQGWTFLDRGAWITTAGNQGRASFTRANGTVMVADGDEYDDGTNVDPNLFNAFMSTPVIPVTNAVANSARVRFDSSFFPFDGQTGLVEVSVDGGPYVNVLTLNTANSGGNSNTSRINQAISVDLPNTENGTVQVRFGYTNAGNDWWWAVDNVDVSYNEQSRAVLLYQDFESLPLGPFVSPTEGGGDGTDWTSTLPTGWTRDNTTTPLGNPVEFQGWNFLDKGSWVNTAGNQERDDFSRGFGTVAVADGDEYDDGTNVDPNLLNTLLITPSINLTKIAANSLKIEFDSSFRPFDTQTGAVDVSFDGGSTYMNLLTLLGGSDVTQRDEHIMLSVNNPSGGEAVFRFGYINAGNDWWWAIDNIQVSGAIVPEPVSAMLTLCGGALLLVRRRRAA